MGSLHSWIITAGLIAGPGYFAYSKMFSGTLVEEKAVHEQGSGFAPITVSLDPAMNMIQFRVTGTSGTSGIGNTFLRIDLRDGGKTLLADTVSFADSSGSTNTSFTMDAFSVPRADKYVLHVTGPAPDKGRKRLYNASIKIYRNVIIANMTIVWTGVAAIVLGFLVGGSGREDQA